MRMPRPIIIVFLVLYCLLVGSCSENYKIDTDFQGMLGKHSIYGIIGINISTYKKLDYYVIQKGKLEQVESLPDPPKPSHQNPELVSEGYSFLPTNIEYRYTGPQLMSPDGIITVASCIKKNTSLHRADSFVVIENTSNKILFSESFGNKEHFTIEGIAWSPRSDAFLILASQSWRPFHTNFLGYFFGHGVVTRDYYLFFYEKDGRLLFRKKIITSLVNGNAKVVWMEKGSESAGPGISNGH